MTMTTRTRRRVSLCENAAYRKQPFCKDDVVRSLGGDPRPNNNKLLVTGRSSSSLRSNSPPPTNYPQQSQQQRQHKSPHAQEYQRQQQSKSSQSQAPRESIVGCVPMDDEMQELEQHILTAGNLAVFESSKYAAIIGAYATASLPLLMHFNALQGDFWLPALTTAIGTSICILLRELARRNMVKGVLSYVIFAVFANVPTFLFVACHICGKPDGAATFIFGTLTFVYPLVVLLSSFIFSKWLCVSTAAAAGVGYAICGYLAMPHLQGIEGFALTTMEDMTSFIMWSNRIVTIFTIGPTAGALATFGRRLAVLAVAEARQRDNVRRLLGEYVSEQIADRLISLEQSTHNTDGDDNSQNNGELVCGERTDCVMLFCDIRSFTAFSESTDATEVVQRLNMWFDVAVKACSAHGGVVDKFIGDAIMVTFGGVVPLTTPSASAVGAAKDMLQACEALNIQFAKQGKPPMACGIGLHRGPVVLGSIGSSERKDFTVIGDAVNTAARLESMCKKYDRNLLISNAVFQDLFPTEQESWDCLGSCPVVGRTEPVQIWSLPKAKKNDKTTTASNTTENDTAAAPTENSKRPPLNSGGSSRRLRLLQAQANSSGSIGGNGTSRGSSRQLRLQKAQSDSDRKLLLLEAQTNSSLSLDGNTDTRSGGSSSRQLRLQEVKTVSTGSITITNNNKKDDTDALTAAEWQSASFTAASAADESVDSNEDIDDATAQLAAERCVAKLKNMSYGSSSVSSRRVGIPILDTAPNNNSNTIETTTTTSSSSSSSSSNITLALATPDTNQDGGLNQPNNNASSTQTAHNANIVVDDDDGRGSRKRRRSTPSLQVLSVANSERSLLSDLSLGQHKKRHVGSTTTLSP